MSSMTPLKGIFIIILQRCHDININDTVCIVIKQSVMTVTELHTINVIIKDVVTRTDVNYEGWYLSPKL